MAAKPKASPTKPVTVNLSIRQQRKAEKIGGGNVSLGVRTALDKFKPASATSA